MHKPFWTNLFSQLGSNRRGRQRSLDCHKTRSLRLEPLEVRQLLAVDLTVNEFSDLGHELMLSIGNARTTEGGDVRFTVTLSEPSDQPVTVRYQTMNATAKRGDADFQHTSGMLYFAPGMTHGMVAVPTGDDRADEGDEHFYLLLSNAKGAVIDTGLGTGVIIDNDSEPLIDVSDAVVATGGEATFIVSLSNPYEQLVTVDYATASGTARDGKQFESKQGTFTFPPGQTVARLYVPTFTDPSIKQDRSKDFAVVLSDPTNATLDRAVGTGTITARPAEEADPVPDGEDIIMLLDGSSVNITIDDPNGTEGYDSSIYFTVSLSDQCDEPVYILWNASDGTAVIGDDYQSISYEMLEISAGEMSGTIGFELVDDSENEADEHFYVHLTSASFGVITDGEGEAMIMDDDEEPSLSISSEQLDEYGGSMWFTVALSNPSGQDVWVSFETEDITATKYDDYEVQDDTIGFSPGQISQTISIGVIDDDMDEPEEEAFLVRLTNPQHATIDGENGVGIGIITDDDDPPSVTIESVSAGENEGSIDFTVSLSNRSSFPVQIEWSTSPDTATEGEDYTGQSATLEISPGELSGTISVELINDDMDEDEEDFSITLSNGVNVTLLDAVETGTIMDDDPEPSVGISGGGSANESDGSIDFTIQLSPESGRSVTVALDTDDSLGQAVEGWDFAGQHITISFSPGETSKTVSIALINDVEDEADEDFRVTLSSPSNAVIAPGASEAVGTIIDDDPPWVSLLCVEPTAAETEPPSPPSEGGFYVCRELSSDEPLTVQLSTGGSAIRGSDYELYVDGEVVGTSVTILANEIDCYVTVRPIDDDLLEDDETVEIDIVANPSDYFIDPQAGSTTLSLSSNDEYFRVIGATVSELDQTVSFRIEPCNADAVFEDSFTFSLSDSPGTALRDFDYVGLGLVPWQVTLDDSNPSATVDITILQDDCYDEDKESFYLELTADDSVEDAQSGQAYILDAYVDVDTDSNNNGTIDDPVTDLTEDGSETSLARLLAVNDDASSKNLAEVELKMCDLSDDYWDDVSVTVELSYPDNVYNVWADANRITRLNDGHTWAPSELPLTLYVDAMTPGFCSADLSVLLSGPSASVTDTVRFDFHPNDIRMADVSPASDEDPGYLVPLNWNYYLGWCIPEDLIPFEIVGCPEAEFRPRLFFSGGIKVWGTQLRQSEIISGDRLGVSQDYVYVEGITEGGSGEMRLQWEDHDGEIVEDRVTISVVHIDVDSVPEYIFANAEYATPIKFTATEPGGRNVEITSISVEMSELDPAGDVWGPWHLGNRFANGDSDSQNNGEDKTYTAFLGADSYGDISLSGGRDHTDVPYSTFFTLDVGVRIPGSNEVTARSDPGYGTVDEEAKIRYFADASVPAIDLGTPSDFSENPVPVRWLGGLVEFQVLKNGWNETWDPLPATVTRSEAIEGAFDNVNAWNEYQYNPIGSYALAKDADDEDDHPGRGVAAFAHGNQFEGQFYVSYGGRDFPPDSNILDPGERAMDLDKQSGTALINMFPTGRATLEVNAAFGGGVSKLSEFSAAAGIVWALGGSTPIGQAAGVASVIAGLLALVETPEEDSLGQALLQRYSSVIYPPDPQHPEGWELLQGDFNQTLLVDGAGSNISEMEFNLCSDVAVVVGTQVRRGIVTGSEIYALTDDLWLTDVDVSAKCVYETETRAELEEFEVRAYAW